MGCFWRTPIGIGIGLVLVVGWVCPNQCWTAPGNAERGSASKTAFSEESSFSSSSNQPVKKESVSETPSAATAARSIRVWGDIGVHPMDRQAACQEAEQNALHTLYEELSQWAQQLVGQKLSYRRLVVEHAWLLAQPGVQQNQQMQVEQKPHGWVARQEITLIAPTPVLARWAERLQQQKIHRTYWFAGGAIATLFGWLLGLWLMVQMDRATGGYYRAGVVLGMFLLLAALTGLGWRLLGSLIGAW